VSEGRTGAEGGREFSRRAEAGVALAAAHGPRGPPVAHYDGCALIRDHLVLEHDLIYCSAVGNGGGPGRGHPGSWAKNTLAVGGVTPDGSARREDHRPGGGFTTGPAGDGRQARPRPLRVRGVYRLPVGAAGLRELRRDQLRHAAGRRPHRAPGGDVG